MATSKSPPAELPKSKLSFMAYLKLSRSPACISFMTGVVKDLERSSVLFCRTAWSTLPSADGIALYSSTSHADVPHPFGVDEVLKFSCQGRLVLYSVTKGYIALHSLTSSGPHWDLTQR